MSETQALEGKTIVLGVTGSIAAFKAVEVLRGLTRAGADVVTLMTQSAPAVCCSTCAPSARMNCESGAPAAMRRLRTVQGMLAPAPLLAGVQRPG